ncbi:MAG TPA: carboxypeptidase regulatory-like domain-containing protein [Pyrinomonadaceae bacterium]|jgi:hypothetical protein|nr:carboxypeptidase regulatory-like domain-containing protein [Pyrinomonadaceae bacterium]
MSLAHVPSHFTRATATQSKSQINAALGRVSLRVFACVLLLVCAASAAPGQTPRPVLLSGPSSTRAVALESVTHAPEPFAPESPIAWGEDRRTRVTLFAMNLALGQGEDASAVSAFAEDASGRRYTLKTEHVGEASGASGVSELIVRLGDDLGDVGDVLVWISYGGLGSNRVRVGIGHVGGGPADDAGAVPTQPVLLAGSVIQNNEGLAGVDVALAGGTSPVTFKTGADGSYFFVAAPLGTYTLTPGAPFYDFEPASRTLDSVETSRTGLFFGARRQTHTLFGQLHDEDGRELFNVTVTLSSAAAGFEPRTTATDDTGQFTFFEVPAGLDYTVTPLDNGVATFTPAQTGQLLEDVSLNLKGKRKTYSIRGAVRDDAGAVKGALVTLEGHSDRTTDTSGAYAFENLPAGLPYTLDASDPDHIYAQGSRTIESLERDERVDFDTTPHFVLSGRVADASGRGVFGVFVSLSGKQEGTTYTDADGRYSLVATAHGDYTLKPSQYQGYYTFSPQSETLSNVNSARAADFGATLSHVSSPSHVLEFDGTAEDVDYSQTFQSYTFFWPENVPLGHFFWELWAMPGENAAATYLISDGYGGAHAILFGVSDLDGAEPGRYRLTGNIWNGAALTSFRGDEGPAPGEWGHYAAGWDGQYVVLYFNGVPVGRTKFDGPRISPGPSGGGGRLYVGGSNHSNFIGRIAQVRGFEDSNPREESSVYSTFRPETVLGVGGNLLSWYFRPARYVDDLSHGYQNLPHSGAVRGWSQETFIFPCFTCPKPEFVVDPTAPNFADPAHPGTPPAPVATPAPVPSNALVFDSFSRRNSTYALGGAGGLDSTEGGKKGALAWRTNVAAGGAQPFGILNGRAVLLANARSLAWVEVGAGFDDFDVRVSRHPGLAESGHDTGLSFRVLDSNNYFFAYTTEGSDPSARLLTVGYYSNGQRTTLASGLATPAGWTTLRVKTNAAGLLEVYADGARVYASQNSLMSTATGAGLYNNGPGLALTNRWDDFAIFATPQN